MCIAAIAIEQHPEYPVIILDNREEIIARETIDAKLQEAFQIVCGVDAQHKEDCGTWMGYHVNSGNFAVLTNVLEKSFAPHFPSPSERVSRGVLVSSVIQNTLAGDHLDEKNYKRYEGYNLLFGNLLEPKVQFTSNRSSSSPPLPYTTKQYTQTLNPGVHCVSNSYLNDMSWPKVRFLHDSLSTLVKQLPSSISPNALRDELAPLLCSRPQFSLQELPEYIQQEIHLLNQLIEGKVEEIPPYYKHFNKEELIIERDDLIAAQTNIFVQSDVEKTRSQTIILAHKSGKIYYYYRNTDGIQAPEPISQILLPYNLYKTETEALMKPFSTQGWKQIY